LKKKKCKKEKLMDINDILYYRLCQNCIIKTIKANTCQFRLTTSSHLPYLVEISIIDKPFQAVNDDDLKKLIDVSDSLVSISANNPNVIYGAPMAVRPKEQTIPKHVEKKIHEKTADQQKPGKEKGQTDVT